MSNSKSIHNEFKDGIHHHNYFPTQRDLDFESISDPVTIKFRPKEKEILQKLADKQGIPLRTMLRRMIIRHVNLQPKLEQIYKILDESLI